MTNEPQSIVDGVEDKDGNTLIPLSRGYTYIFYSSSGFFIVSNSSGRGVCNKNGEELISPKRGYDNVVVQKDYISVGKNRKEGACDLTGKEIISPTRGYDHVIFLKKYNYYGVKKNGKCGACDYTGKEVVTPIYDDDILYYSGKYHYKDANGNFVEINPNSSSSSSYASSSSTSSSRPSSTTTSTSSRPSTSTASSTTSRYGSLIKSGTYTSSGVINVMGNISAVGYPYLTKFDVYTNYLVDETGNAYPLSETLKFEGVNCRSYKCNNDLFYIYGDDQKIRKLEYQTILGIRTSTISYYMPGDVRAAYSAPSTPNTGGGTTYGGSSSAGAKSTGLQSCKVCYGTGNCQTCTGRGWVINHYTNKYSPCSTCNNEQGTSPKRGKCYACKGTGKR
jgi:hypothetical protein